MADGRVRRGSVLYDAQYLNLHSFRRDGRFVVGDRAAGGDHFIEYSKILEDFLRSRLNTFTAGADKGVVLFSIRRNETP